MADYIPIFLDWIDTTQELNAAEKGRLVDALVMYAQGGSWQELIQGNERYVFPVFKGQLDRHLRKVDTLKANGSKTKKSEAKSSNAKQTEANRSKTEQTEAKTYNNNNNYNDNHNDNDNDNHNALEQQQETRAREPDASWEAFVKEYEMNIGLFPHSQYEAEELVDDYETLGSELMSEAIRATALAHTDNPHVYLRSVCRKWRQVGITTAEQARTAIMEFRRKKEAKSTARTNPTSKADAFLAMMEDEDDDAK
ncbi:MAG: DnaD domain protein [Clostridia bacterium]|nr:DnaD domain protein [Clostridia bacterium]